MQRELAICIDCWIKQTQPSRDNINQPHIKNIISFVESRPEIASVVLASYDTWYEYMNSNTLWYTEMRSIFNPKMPYPQRYHFDHYERSRIYSPRDHDFPEQWTEPNLLHHEFIGKHQIAMHHFWQLEYYLQTNQQFDTIWIFGGGWLYCCKTRELGYERLHKLTGCKIKTNAQCIDGSLDIVNDPAWEYCNDSIYVQLESI